MLRRRQQRDLAGGAREDAVADHRLDRRVAGAREVVGDTELARRVAVLAIPGDREARRGVEVALLLVEHLVEDLVDPRERRAHGHRRAVVLDDLRVAREHRHPRADRGLRQVDRRDRALLELAQRVGQLVVKRGDETAAVGRRRVVGTRAQRENDRGGEGVRADAHASGRRRSLRIGHVAVIAQPERIIPSSSVSQPVDAVPSSPASDCLNA